MSDRMSLQYTAGTTIGAKIVQSAAYFQAGAANLFGAQGKAIQRTRVCVSTGSFCATTLFFVSRQVDNSMSALYHVQRYLQEKIAAGTHIHDNSTW